MIPNRLHLILAIAIIIYFVMMCIFLKNKALSLKYSLLWLAAGVVLAILVLFPDLLAVFCNLCGIQSPMNGLFIWAIAFIICILLSLTSIVSKQNNKIRQLIQVISRLEERIRELENDK